MNKTVTVKRQIKDLLNELNEGLYGKEDTMKIVLLAILAGESAFLLGEPGTAKSMVSRRIADAFEDLDDSLPENKGMVKYYEYLMNQFSTPDELFGPVSLESLKKDEYKRITDRFLPKAKFAFLDEIWKASPAIQNALLTILNEKKFHNGSTAEKVPLIGFIAASNELPQKDAGLDAIFDRFLVRILEKPIQKDSDFFDMITAPKNSKVEIKNKLSEELITQWQLESNNVSVPYNCCELISNIKKSLAEKNKEENRDDEDKYLVSDRRWKKITGLLRMNAFLNDRTSVDFSDFDIVPFCIWSSEKQYSEVFKIINDNIKENVKNSGLSNNKKSISMDSANQTKQSESTSKSLSLKKTNLIAGKSFCFTGALNSMTRDTAEENVKNYMGTVKSTVTNNLDYLVTNNTSSGSVKNQKAASLGIKVINEKQFKKMLDDAAKSSP